MKQIKLELMDELEMPTYDNTYQGLVEYSGIYGHEGKKYQVTYCFDEDEINKAEETYPTNPQEILPWDDEHVIDMVEI